MGPGTAAMASLGSTPGSAPFSTGSVTPRQPWSRENIMSQYPFPKKRDLIDLGHDQFFCITNLNPSNLTLLPIYVYVYIYISCTGNPYVSINIVSADQCPSPLGHHPHPYPARVCFLCTRVQIVPGWLAIGPGVKHRCPRLRFRPLGDSYFMEFENLLRRKGRKE